MTHECPTGSSFLSIHVWGLSWQLKQGKWMEGTLIKANGWKRITPSDTNSRGEPKWKFVVNTNPDSTVPKQKLQKRSGYLWHNFRWKAAPQYCSSDWVGRYFYIKEDRGRRSAEDICMSWSEYVVNVSDWHVALRYICSCKFSPTATDWLTIITIVQR